MRAGVAPPEVLSLVADPRRWQLLAELSLSDRRVGELCELVDHPQSLVSYHLGALRKAGIVTSRRSSADGRDRYYRADLIRLRDLLGDAGGALHPGLRLAPPPTPSSRPTSNRQARVLFLCTGNSARSQMAEALVEHRSKHTILARSAGSRPKPLHPNAVKVMAARGIDIADRPTKHLRRFARMRFDRVVTLCDKVSEICPEFPGAPAVAHWSMADPSAAGDADDATLPAFEQTAAEIEVRVSLLIAELTVGDEPNPTPQQTKRKAHAR